MIDSDIIYLTNTKSEKRLIQNLINNYNLNLCYHTKKKKVFSNDSLLIACHKNYNTIQVYSSKDDFILKQVQKELMRCT